MNWSTRRQTLIGLGIVIALVAFVGVWGSVASIAGAVVAMGQVDTAERNQVVEHPDGGTVARILVAEGDVVAQGDVLLELDDGALSTQWQIVTDQVLSLQVEAARLTSEQMLSPTLRLPEDLVAAAKDDPKVKAVIDLQQAVFDARLQTYNQTVRSLGEQQSQRKSEVEGQTARESALNDQLVLMRSEFEDAQTLREKGLVKVSAVRDLERQTRALEGEVAGVKAAIAAASSEVARLDVEVARVTSARQEEASAGLRDTENKLSELLEQQRELSRRLDRLRLRAPLAGTIHELTVHNPGSVIRPADPVLYVVPQDAQLRITARIDAAHIDSVGPGQDAMLRFSSFESRTTPELAASVSRVSANVSVDERTGASFYTADLVLKEGEADKLEGKELVPGMPVEVYIQTGSRSPLSYVFKPFTDYVNRAFKE